MGFATLILLRAVDVYPGRDLIVKLQKDCLHGTDEAPRS